MNGLVLNALLRCEVPAASLPASPRWRKRRNVMGSGAALCADVARAWRAGLLPVLHGDAVFDERQCVCALVRVCIAGTFVPVCIGACVHSCIGA